MNLVEVREEIERHINQHVEIQINGLRNKKAVFQGTIIRAYPNLFVVKNDDVEKSFSYADLITKEVVVKYL